MLIINIISFFLVNYMANIDSLDNQAKNDITMFKEWNVVIRKNIKIDKSLITQFCEYNCLYYVFIEHENDLNEIGEIEGCHYHLVLTFKCLKRKSTVLNQICKFFVNYYSVFTNDYGIECSPLINYNGAVKYLCHKTKDSLNKTPHDLLELVSNVSQEELFSIFDEEETKPRILSVDYIVDLSYKYGESNFDLLIREIGFSRYERNRNTIRDIYKAVRLRVEREERKQALEKLNHKED